jgi:hypothetical protein
MRAFILSVLLGLATLGGIATTAEARPWHGGNGYYGRGYYSPYNGYYGGYYGNRYYYPGYSSYYYYSPGYNSYYYDPDDGSYYYYPGYSSYYYSD